MWHETCWSAEMNGGMKKFVGRWQKRKEHLRNGYREEIGLPMTDNGHREWSKLQKEWQTGDGGSDLEMISRATKICFGKR